MYLFGDEKIKDVSSARLLLALDEINAELEDRRKKQAEKALFDMMDKIKALVSADKGYVKIIDVYGNEVFLKDIVELYDGDTGVSIT